MGTLTGSEELAATIGPALSGSGQAAWTLLPSYPTLEPAVKLLLDTPEYFTTYWNTCLHTFPQLAGQLVVGKLSFEESINKRFFKTKLQTKHIKD